MPTETTDTSSSPSKRLSPWLIVAVCVAAVLQSVLVSMSPAIARDGITFIETARSLQDDPVRTMRLADQHPGYPALLLVGRAVVAPLTGTESVLSWTWGGRLVSGVFGVGLIISVWLLARRTINAHIAGIAALLAATLPLFRQSAADVLSDTPHLFFATTATWLVVEGMTRARWTWFLGAGLACGCAYWIRPEGLSVAVAAAVAFPLVAWRCRTATASQVVACLAAMAVAAAAVACPYWLIGGKLTSKATTKPYLASAEEPREGLVPSWLRGPEPDPDDLETVRWEPPPYEPPWQIVTGGVFRLVRKTGQCLRWVLLLPLVSGLIGFGRTRSHTPARMLIATLLVVHLALLAWVYYAGRYIDERHVMVPAVLLMPWIASGCTILARRLSWYFRRRRPERSTLYQHIALGVVIAFFIAFMLPRTLRTLHATEVPAIETALCLKEHAHEGDAVITNAKYVLFYSGMPGRLIGYETEEAPLRPSAAEAPYRFIVIDRRRRPLGEDWDRALEERYRPYPIRGIAHDQVRTLILR